MVEANLVGTVLAAVLCLAWFVTRIEASQRRQLLDWTTNLRNLNASEFEWLVGEMFRREGWKVKESGRDGLPDGNVDLEVSRDRDRRLVQCKRWTSWSVGVDDVRRFAGALMRERISGEAGVFVTLSTFTDQARDEAANTGIELIDGRALASRLEKVRRSEPCPNCSVPMTFDRSPRGWWFRCRQPGCTGKLDLGQDVGAAVQFLTSG